ncbi:hypothetical protein, partial [uncultured Allobaculum sp.]|uniref:hypothetical protein n=1 Tax=uncultured Allobaculum sp. TaxID=1187017 RepID=UPI0026F18FB1
AKINLTLHTVCECSGSDGKKRRPSGFTLRVHSVYDADWPENHMRLQRHRIPDIRRGFLDPIGRQRKSRHKDG